MEALARSSSDEHDAATPPRTHIGHVLFTSDLSGASDAAFGHAHLVAEATGARMTLMHVLEPHRVLHDQSPGAPEDELYRRAENDAREELGRRPRGEWRVDVLVERAPSVAPAITAAVERLGVDLLVMATHGRDGFGHLFVGSVAERLLRHPPCAILCVRGQEHGSAVPYRRILVPTDLSPRSRRAFPIAAALARGFGADVVAVHVTSLPGSRVLGGVPEMVETFVPSDDEVRAFLQPELKGVRVAPRVDMGMPARRVVEAARAERVDLLVVSTHGHDSLADRVVGTRAEWMVRHAPCPVVVV